ncbi:MAG: hypothetical protein FWF28_03455 [Micrococcales bacterium]|nr:hypothetical protein [Micrococcales bacterium]
MPTALVRHSITETPAIAAAIDTGVSIMPGASRSEVARYLILRGAQAARADGTSRRAAVERWAGCLTGAYSPNAARALKDEWPD